MRNKDFIFFPAQYAQERLILFVMIKSQMAGRVTGGCGEGGEGDWKKQDCFLKNLLPQLGGYVLNHILSGGGGRGWGGGQGVVLAKL